MLSLIFFILVSCQVTITNPNQETAGVYDYTGLLSTRDLNLCKAIAKQYTPDATIYVLDDQPLSYNILGLANQIGPNTYVIQLNNNNYREMETLFHELGHIIDAEQGILDFRGDMYWNGEKCDFTTLWWERPWEISANQWRECLRYEYETGQLEYYSYYLELEYVINNLLPKNLNSHNANCEE
jgi:hypothetical protein